MTFSEKMQIYVAVLNGVNLGGTSKDICDRADAIISHLENKHPKTDEDKNPMLEAVKVLEDMMNRYTPKDYPMSDEDLEDVIITEQPKKAASRSSRKK